MKIEPQSNDERKNLSAYQCPECLAGVMHMEAVTYFTWLHKELVTVPNFPAWVCDMCGRREFDARAITWLNTLLNPAAGRSSSHKSGRGSRISSSDQPQT